MLKITPISASDGHQMFLLEGRVVDVWVAELQNLCDAKLREASSLTLDLSGVSFVDRTGANVLHSLAQSRVALTGARPFVAEQLHGEGVPHETEIHAKPGKRS
jgi:anti-anti-sigma regulatory factor